MGELGLGWEESHFVGEIGGKTQYDNTVTVVPGGKRNRSRDWLS